MARMSVEPLKVKEHFVNKCKQCCQDTAKRDSLQAVFEGLADITKFPDTKVPFFTEFNWFTDEEKNENLCVINGRYRDKDEEAVAVAIGVWDETKGCCSAISKLKDGRNLPAPFRVIKGFNNSIDMDSICAAAHTILKEISRCKDIEKALAIFKMNAKKQQ